MTSYKNRDHDQRVADESGTDPSLMCPAHGCPRKWAVQGDRGQACSAHYWADRADWPRITEDVQRAEVDIARKKSNEPPVVAVSRAERSDILAKLANIGHKPAAAGKAWAYALRDRHEAGEQLTPAQVAMYRRALAQDAIRSAAINAQPFDLPPPAPPMPPALDLPPVDAYEEPRA
jgi:hypothetical protein